MYIRRQLLGNLIYKPESKSQIKGVKSNKPYKEVFGAAQAARLDNYFIIYVS